MTFISNNPHIVTKNGVIAKSYQFFPSTKTIVIDGRFDAVILVVNLETGATLYNPLRNIGGSILNHELVVDLDTTSMSSSDELLILIDKKEESNQEGITVLILEELRYQTELLKGILE